MNLEDIMNGVLSVRKVWWHFESPPLLINLTNSVFTDIVGYTKLMGEDEPKAFKKEKG